MSNPRIFGGDYLGKTILVVGAARSGIAAARFLLARGARVVLTDVRNEESLSAVLASMRGATRDAGELVLELNGHRPESFENCDFAVVSPGVPLSLPLFDKSRRAGIPILAEVELAYRHLQGKILGITGSNGKTTTTTLVTELLRGSGLKGYSAGNIGEPLIGFAERSAADDIYATELSSFQLEGIHQLRPGVAAILNVTPDHLDRYRGFEEYIEAKRRIFVNQTSADFAVLNKDDPHTAAIVPQVASQVYMFSRRSETGRGAFVHGDHVIYSDGAREKVLFAVSKINLIGVHNLENVLAACTIAILAGADPETMESTVRNFKCVEHRLEWVAEIDGVQYFNDSKATNVDAVIKSLESFTGNVHLIAGGQDKGGDFTELRAVVEGRVKRLVLIGEAAGKIREALAGSSPLSEAETLADAVQTCRKNAQPGDVVLLAPACASFDMFQNYEQRGRVFKQAVRDLETRS